MKKNTFILLLLCSLVAPTLQASNDNILISTPNSSMVLHTTREGRQLQFAYFGNKIQDNQVNQLFESQTVFNSPAYPVFGTTTFESSALQAVHVDGNQTLDLRVEEVKTTSDKNSLLTVITLRDRVYPFTVKLHYRAFQDVDIIETWTEYTHSEKKAVTLRRFDSGHFIIHRGDVWLSSLHGSWAAETQVVNEPLLSGMKVIKNMDGVRNGLGEHAEVMFSLDGKPQENSGRVIGAVLCWGGRTKIRIDTDDICGRNVHHIFAGMNEEVSEYKLEPKEVFTTPKLALTYSKEGLGGASCNFHRWARNGRIHGCDKPRDILLNSWEGVYLNIKEPEMEQMMNDIASLGGELFVMDDGWFGGKYPRTEANSSLGDWTVDTTKLPNGIKGLTDMAKKQGIKFGIWIEPEFTNTKSELIEKHPDWVLQPQNRNLSCGRGGTQVALDLCNPKVQDFVFNLVDTLLTNYPDIAYIKWDANGEIKNYGSYFLPQDKQTHIYINYQRGLINVLERIRSKYPDVVIQACGSGGGRASYGILPYYDEFWVSDNTDALQRLFIQWGVSYFYPAIAMAQHVSASPNHQTGRVLPLKFRFDIAMTGRLGMEIQPKDMSEEEKVFSKKAISTYKEIRPVIQNGDQYRLISPYDHKGVASLMYITEDKGRAVFFAYKLEHFLNQLTPQIHLAGLNPDKKYRVRELNATPDSKPCYLHDKVFSGSILMETGFKLQMEHEYASYVLEIIEVK